MFKEKDSGFIMEAMDIPVNNYGPLDLSAHHSFAVKRKKEWERLGYVLAADEVESRIDQEE